MTGERPDDAREPDDAARPATGADGQEAPPASASDARFPGLRSAADIFGAPRSADEWPSRRERREAERAAAETGAPLPEPFEPPTVPSAPEAPEAPEAPAVPEAPAAPEQPIPDAPLDESTQAISMPEELARPSQPAQPASDPDRSLLGSRIPAAAPVPPNTTAPHPSSIVLPTAQAHRDERAAQTRAIEDERRRTDPRGEGRDDVDWLGRATGAPLPPAGIAGVPAPTGPIAQPVGVPNALPPTEEPPSFTDLLRIAPTAEPPQVDRPFDWAVQDDVTGEVPTTLTSNPFDTTTTATPIPSAERTDPAPAPMAVPAPTPAPAPETESAPATESAPDTDSGSWSLVDDAVRTGETPWWAEPDAAQPTPTTQVPPLVEPTPAQPASANDVYPAHLPPAVGEDLDAILGIRGATDTGQQDTTLPRTAPDDLDQSEWDGRETSDTSAIKDLFGTQAVNQLGTTGYDPHDTGTRMMPAAITPAHAPAPGRSAYAAGPPVPPPADSGNFINEGFAKLRGEGKRGKQLLIGGAIVIILVMLVAVFALTRWIIGNNIEEHTTPTKSPAAASASITTKSSAAPAAAPTPASAPTISFATTTASAGQHAWYELAGGEYLTPFTNAWAEDFTVVDCSAAHLAQLTSRGAIEADAYPGTAEAQRIATDQCQSTGALNVTAASSYGDVQVQSVYPPDAASWQAGDRFWSCFVTRSGGGTMTGSLAPSA
ncbi:septum formation family protein [Curtobacterium sp. ZW137]|uniref:septum formation family protein n=1 Tax=Curtobacterium sp. ZW137 TaxID=2485104 RepID=UPI000F4BE800|nr:septum formation family protein [Curtobacterium sp. ZW137]ROP65085.1 putative regulator of septum formation [Curtobacterium sp. ZW137]